MAPPKTPRTKGTTLPRDKERNQETPRYRFFLAILILIIGGGLFAFLLFGDKFALNDLSVSRSGAESKTVANTDILPTDKPTDKPSEFDNTHPASQINGDRNPSIASEDYLDFAEMCVRI
ncbi:hypothetical protein HK097_008896, partial [Rhizophlyctis rosea]